MKLSEIKSVLENLETISFELPNGELVPNHFHVTEVGQITKDFIDCGGGSKAKDKGKLRLEGKDYIINDGDVLNFRFNT